MQINQNGDFGIATSPFNFMWQWPHAYKIQLYQHIMSTYHQLRAKSEMLSCTDRNNFIWILSASQPRQPHLWRKAKKHSCHIWEHKNSHTVLEHETDTMKMNVRCRLMKDHVIDHFFHKATVTGNVNLVMIENSAVGPIHHGSTFKHDGTSSYHHNEFHRVLSMAYYNLDYQTNSKTQ